MICKDGYHFHDSKHLCDSVVKGGISGGVIAGIVIGVLTTVIVGGILIFKYHKHKKMLKFE